jgi:hypothetical protein
MIIGLGDPVYEGPEQFPGELRPVTVDTGGGSSVTFGPMTIRPQTVARVYSPAAAARPSVLAKVFPVKVGPDGKARIWGLPPAVAYALAAVMLAGAGLWVYQRAGGGRRVAANPPRRRRSRRASRRKR